MPGRAAAATAACSPRLPAADARCPRRHMCVCTRSQTHTHTHACAQFGAHMYISHKRMHTAHAAPAGRPRCGARVLWVATARNLQAVAGGRHDAPQAVLGGAGLRGRLLGQLLRPHPRCRGGPDAVGGRRRRVRGGPVRGVLAELEVRRHGRGSASEERRCPSASAESRTAGDACCGTHTSAIFRSCSKAKHLGGSGRGQGTEAPRAPCLWPSSRRRAGIRPTSTTRRKYGSSSRSRSARRSGSRCSRSSSRRSARWRRCARRAASPGRR